MSTETNICITTGCKRVKEIGKSRCAHCLRQRRIYERRRRAIARLLGKCTSCGVNHNESGRLCAECKRRGRARANKYNLTKQKKTAMLLSTPCVLCEANSVISCKDNSGNMFRLCSACWSSINKLSMLDNRPPVIKLISKSPESKTRTRPLMIGWLPIRKEVIRKSRGYCAVCESKRGNLLVYHKDGHGLMTANPNNNLGNLIAICQPCQRAIAHLRASEQRLLACRLIYGVGPGTSGTPLSQLAG